MVAGLWLGNAFACVGYDSPLFDEERAVTVESVEGSSAEVVEGVPSDAE